MDESSLADLFQSAVDAFPHTTKRQHATSPIRITEIRWEPFIGVRTLFVKGTARSEAKEYAPIILFKNVNYNQPGVRLQLEGRIVTFGSLSNEETQVTVRCNCADFKYRFNFYDHVDRSLYGRVRAPYENQGGPPANPQEMPGMCKHLIKLWYSLQESGLFS